MPHDHHIRNGINNVLHDVLSSLDLLTACPNSGNQPYFSKNENWKFYFQHFLPFINVYEEINDNLYLKKKGKNHLIFLDDERDIYLKRGNELYVQKQDGQRLYTRYKTAFFTEIRSLLKAIENNNNNWQDNIRKSKHLRSDKSFMLAAVNRNHFAFDFASPSLKSDRELLNAYVKKIKHEKREYRKHEVKYFSKGYDSLIITLALGLSFLQLKYTEDTPANNVLTALLPFALIMTGMAKKNSVYGLFAKKYPGNRNDSYEAAHEEHKGSDDDEFSDDESSDDDSEFLSALVMPLEI